MSGNFRPVRLVQVLAHVLGRGVVLFVRSNGFRPVIGSPHHINAGERRPGAEPASPCEQIDSLHGFGTKWKTSAPSFLVLCLLL